MKFISKHKSSIVGLLIFIAVLAAFFLFKNTVMFEENQAIYGSRLEGEEKVKVTKEQEQKVSEAAKDIVKSVYVRQSGKIINIIAEVNPETSLTDAKSIGDKTYAIFTEEQKKFFDFQFLIDNPKNTDQFPIAGYKNKSREAISWTKDRAKTEG